MAISDVHGLTGNTCCLLEWLYFKDSWGCHDTYLYLVNQFRAAKINHPGGSGWLSQLTICLQLRSGPQSPGIEPHTGLPAQREACFSLTLCLLLPSACAHLLSLSNRYVKSLKENKNKKASLKDIFQALAFTTLAHFTHYLREIGHLALRNNLDEQLLGEK